MLFKVVRVISRERYLYYVLFVEEQFGTSYKTINGTYAESGHIRC